MSLKESEGPLQQIQTVPRENEIRFCAHESKNTGTAKNWLKFIMHAWLMK